MKLIVTQNIEEYNIIGIGIGLSFKKRGIDWPNYWLTRYISELSVLTTSDTTQTVTATIIGTGYGTCYFEYTTNGTTWTVAGNAANGIYSAIGLTAGTLYGWRARLSKGVNYGSYSSIDYDATTSPTLTFTDVDGNSYTAILIGTQLWMGQNLKTTKFKNGDAISNITDNATWAAATAAAYAWYNNDSATYKDPYGALYNHFAVRSTKGLAPLGWHVPTRAEFQALSTALGGDTVSGGHLKEVGTVHWNSPNVGADNSSLFAAVGGGNRVNDGTWASFKVFAIFWTTTYKGTINYYLSLLNVADDNCYNDYDNPQKTGYSIRCVSDYTSPLSAFKMATYSEADLNTMRTTLINAIWPAGYPATGKDHISTGVAEPMASSAANLASIDQLTFHITGIADRTPYVWHPTVSNGKFVIWHLDHFYPTTGTDIWEIVGRADAIRALIDAGYTVCGILMPQNNIGLEGATHSDPNVTAPFQTVVDLHYFFDTTIRVLNEYAGQFSAFYMAGLSGGGWTTSLIAALDERITKSCPIAGTLPLSATDFVGELRDWEQHLSTLSATVDYGDIYAMACTSGRRQLQARNAFEGDENEGFNVQIYNKVPFKAQLETITGGRCKLVWDMVTTVHEVTANIRTQMIAFFDE